MPLVTAWLIHSTSAPHRANEPSRFARLRLRLVLRRFSELLGEFQMAYDLELTRDYQPPEDLYIRVNVLQDIGQ